MTDPAKRAESVKISNPFIFRTISVIFRTNPVIFRINAVSFRTT